MCDDDGPQLYLIEPSGAGHVRSQLLLSRVLLWLPDKLLCSMVEALSTLLKACRRERIQQAQLAEAPVLACGGDLCKSSLLKQHH